MTAETGQLSWTEPEDDGGSDITAYILEKKDVSRRSWQDGGETLEKEHTVSKLIEGNKYIFRVSAKNKYGVSEPVEISEPVTAKNDYGK